MIVVFNSFPLTGVQGASFTVVVGRAASAAAEIVNEVVWLAVQ